VRSKHFKKLPARSHGWTLDVLIAVRSLDKTEFSNADIYGVARHLKKLHPKNRHVTNKIRQQLQVLRDLGFLTHIADGKWRLK